MTNQRNPEDVEPVYNGTDHNAGDTSTECPYAEEVEDEPTVTIRASLFFDGTLNNRTNVGIGADGAAWGANQGSYDNDYSNISKHEEMWIRNGDYDHSFSIYTEGIGTQNRGSDIPNSMAYGWAYGGVKEKVQRGTDAMIRNIRGLGISEIIDYVHIDSFGFSRGAAAARYFIYHAFTDPDTRVIDRLRAAGLRVNAVTMKFCGLFDTVASYGGNHSNDTRDLELDAISGAEYTYQLAAAEEHRKNFRLTNINSKAAGKQIFLPGVHSDVGGGYNHDADEEELQVFDIDSAGWNSDAQNAAIRRERAWLVSTGWYESDELHDTNFWNEVHVTRRNISNRYSRIPLHLMAEKGREKGVLVSPRSLVARHPVSGFLREVRQAIDDYIGSTATSRPNDWFHSNTRMMKRLRHDYLHFSSFYGGVGAHQPQWTSDDPIHGRRRRIIQNG